MVGWAGCEPATSASRTNQPPTYQPICGLHGTAWGPVGDMRPPARGQDVGKPRPAETATALIVGGQQDLPGGGHRGLPALVSPASRWWLRSTGGRPSRRRPDPARLPRHGARRRRRRRARLRPGPPRPPPSPQASCTTGLAVASQPSVRPSVRPSRGNRCRWRTLEADLPGFRDLVPREVPSGTYCLGTGWGWPRTRVDRPRTGELRPGGLLLGMAAKSLRGLWGRVKGSEQAAKRSGGRASGP